MDNSTDPPFQHIDFYEVEEEFGKIANMSPDSAMDTLERLVASHWLPTDEADDVKRALATKAGILGDYDTLENWGIEQFYVPKD
jgi:hypothetical protein